MDQIQSSAIIQKDLVIKGKISNGRCVEVHGYVEGEIWAERLVIHEGGRVFGSIRTDNAEINGTLQGTVSVKELITIGSKGTVHGNVRYGSISMTTGGELSADLTNVPPEIAGDLNVVVRRGRSAQITLADLNAVDPDDTGATLMFTVSNMRNGFIALAGAPSTPIDRFTQQSLEGGEVMFVHDGTEGSSASFDVIVADKEGASSGAAQTVTVSVLARA